MAIDNITRTATIDEWRIQTNQSAGELNKLETGDYTKSNGTFAANGTSRIFVGGTGTALEVVNTASFQNNIVVSKTISLGDFNSGTGNLSVGNTSTFYGNVIVNGLGEGLYVANTANIRDLIANTASINLITEVITFQNVATFTDNVGVTGTLDVTGDFTVSGNLVYDTDSLILSASTPKDTGYATIGINRTGANAEIRWSTSDKEWQIRDVDNSTSYSKILTANLISNSIISISESTVASSNAANILNIKIDTLSDSVNTQIENLTTTDIEEGSNLYFTSARVRANVSNTAPINYDSSTGTFSHAVSGVTATGYGDSVSIPVLVVNTTGHITSVSNTTIRSGTTAQTGIVQLTDSISSTSTTTAATPNSVKTSYDLANTANTTASNRVSSVSGTSPIVSSGGLTPTISHAASGVSASSYGDSVTIPVFAVNTTGHVTGVTNTTIRSGTTGQSGIVQLTDSTSSTSTTTAATANSVRAAYAAAIAYVQSMYPVGSIYINASNSTNPATLLGFGTWTAFGSGRVMIGDGAGYSAGQTGGSADAIVVSHTHSISDPGHTHTTVTRSTTDGTSGSHTYMSGVAGSDAGTDTTQSSTVQSSTTGVSVNSTGLSGTNANLPPYIVVYMWRRTS